MAVEIAENLSLDPQRVLTGRCCIIGQSGSGKSYMIGVLSEELCRNGLPFLIIDTEGEYGSLKSAFSLIRVGGSGADLDIDTDYWKLLETSISRRIPVIFDLSDTVEKAQAVSKLLGVLYKIEERKKSPYLVIVEEADQFAPQSGRRPGNIIEEISVRGRKRGVGLVVATQRPAAISKNVLAQCSYGFIGKLTIENDLNAVSVLVGSRAALLRIPKFSSGEFMPFGLGSTDQILVRGRSVVHGGSTPVISGGKTTEKSLEKIIRELKSTGSAGAKPESSGRQRASIESLVENIGIEKARDFSAGMLRRRFGLFGSPKEVVESVVKRYVELAVCCVRLPTGRRKEFDEYYLVIDSGLNFFRIGNRIDVLKSQATRPFKITAAGLALLYAISKNGKADLKEAAEISGLGARKAQSELDRLARSGLVHSESGRFRIADRREALCDAAPKRVRLEVDSDSIEGSDELREGEARQFVLASFPGCSIISIDKVYMPLYRITLRRGNRVRLFSMDAVTGGRLDG